MIKSKKCSECDRPAFSKGLCATHQKKRPIKTKPKEINQERKDYFIDRVDYIINNNLVCEECGEKLRGNISEVAHIISKSKNPEVESDKNNIVYLCGVPSNNSCHSKFDQSFNKRGEMKCFNIALDRFELFEKEIINNTNEVQFMRNGRIKS